MTLDNSCIVTLDLGTTHIKTFVYSLSGIELLAYQADTPYNANGHQEAKAVLDVSLTLLKSIFSGLKEINIVSCGISISAAMHSVVPVNKEIEALDEALIWSDNQGFEIASTLHDSSLGDEIFQETGTPIHPMSPLIKIAWLRKTKTQLFAQASHFISLKEFVYFHLTGGKKIDYSIASATGMFNSKNLKWSTKALNFAGITETYLFEPVSPYTKESLLPGLVNLWNLAPSYQVIIGASDGCLASLGAAPLINGNISLSMGTSAALRSPLSDFKTESKGRLFTYLLDEKHFVIGGPSNNSGNVFAWLTRLFCSGVPIKQDFQHMLDLAAKIEPGADGLIFQPWLYGERAPYWDATLTGGFKNFKPNHSAAHMSRAVIEGVLFNFKTILLLIQESVPIEKVYIGGGLAKFPLWQQLLADIFNLKVFYGGEKEDSSAGAAILGFKAMALINDLENQDAFYHTETELTPDPNCVILYEELYKKFMSEKK